MHWQNRILMCAEFKWNPVKLIFAWINILDYPFIDDKYLGISNNAGPIGKVFKLIFYC
jgi:hypothetical protein